MALNQGQSMSNEKAPTAPGATLKLVVTCRGLYTTRQTRRILRKALPEAQIHGAGVTGIFLVEAPGDALELAEKVNRECSDSIGRATPALAVVVSERKPIEDAAVRIGTEQIGEQEKFCFRLHKRGMHMLEEDTPKLEYEIGGAIWESLEGKHGKRPLVDLRTPDVMVIAEVLGHVTVVGILRRAWRQTRLELTPP